MPAPIILGLDVAATTGFCHGAADCDRPVFGNVKFTREGEAGSFDGTSYAAGRAMEWAIDITRIVRPDYVAIEAPIPETQLNGMTNAWTTALKFQLLGALGAVCRMRELPLRFVNIQRVRKHFLGHGNLPGDFAKREVMRFCKAAGWTPKTHDEADAGAVWHHEASRVAPDAAAIITPIFLNIAPVEKPVREPKRGRS